MSKEQYNFSAGRSRHENAEWGHPLVSHHQPHPYFPQQDLHRSQDVCIHPSSMEAANLQLTAAASTIRNLKASIDDCMKQCQAHINVSQSGMPSHHVNMLALQASTKDNHKSSVDITQRLQQLRSGEEFRHPRKASRKPGAAIFSQSKHTKSSAPKRMCSTFISPLTVRPVGTKDRHSKVRTAKGLRDRRVRLSAPTAIQFFDVQDRLGYDQPSQAVDWLIKKARAAIDELAPIDGVPGGDEIVSGRLLKERKSSRLHDLRAKDDEQVLTETPGARAESRAKARERARERAKEKTITPVPPPTNTSVDTITTSSTSTAGPPSSHWPFNASNVQLLPDFFLISGQFQQQLDELHRPSDLSFMVKPPSALPSTSQLIPFSSAFCATSSTAPSYIIPEDTPLQHLTPTTTAHTSPRGTLQSIFSDRTTSSMRAHAPIPSLAMMGDPAQVYWYDATLSSLVQDQGEHDQHVPFQRSSAVFMSVDSHQHSHIPMRMRGMELGSHVEETRITSSSMQAYYQ